MRILVLYLFIFFLILPTTYIAQGDKQNVMEKLANGLKDYEHTITDWNVTVKEQMSQEDALKKVEELKKDFSVTKTGDENSKKYQVTDSNQITNGIVNFTVILPDKAHFKAEFIMSINGHKWNESIKQTSMKQVEILKRNYFSDESKTFACLTANVHDTMNSVYFVDKMKETYQAEILLEQTDSIESSMIKDIKYGYTPLWREKIRIDGKPINLQFVIKRTTDDDLEITVGTPILINEY